MTHIHAENPFASFHPRFRDSPFRHTGARVGKRFLHAPRFCRTRALCVAVVRRERDAKRHGDLANLDHLRTNPRFRFIGHDISNPLKVREKLDVAQIFCVQNFPMFDGPAFMRDEARPFTK